MLLIVFANALVVFMDLIVHQHRLNAIMIIYYIITVFLETAIMQLDHVIVNLALKETDVNSVNMYNFLIN